MLMRVPVIAMACLLAWSPAATAQETRTTPENHVPPPATLDDVMWLVGQWDGEGIGGNRALESWLPPTGDTMVGSFVQTTDGGGIQFTEHLYLMEEEGSLVLRLKHFNADLTGWEDRDGMLTFRLVAVEDCAAFFGGLTLRCDGPDGLVAAVRMRSREGEINELIFRFRRASTAASTNPCADAASTIDLNECYLELLSEAEERRGYYLGAAVARYPDDAELTRQIVAADEAYSQYVESACGAVYDYWISGSIRNVMTLTCRIDLLDRGTHNIWRHWLTYMDSSPPLLPEPAPTLPPR